MSASRFNFDPLSSDRFSSRVRCSARVGPRSPVLCGGLTGFPPWFRSRTRERPRQGTSKWSRGNDLAVRAATAAARAGAKAPTVAARIRRAAIVGIVPVWKSEVLRSLIPAVVRIPVLVRIARIARIVLRPGGRTLSHDVLDHCFRLQAACNMRLRCLRCRHVLLNRVPVL